MSKKNSNVRHKLRFERYPDLEEIYLKFKKKIKSLKKKKILIAVSGGPDSLALVALSKIYSLEDKIKFYYVLIDHKIRKNSSKEAKQVKTLLKKNNIKLTIISNNILINKNIQGQARTIRYGLILNFCKKQKISAIITAHNLEDQVETFFIRLSRGSGLTGLSSIQPISKLDKNVKLFRPLLDVKKKFLIRISLNFFGKYFKDPSNKNPKYLRTKVRNLEKPLKKSGIIYDQVIKSINNLASSKAILDDYYQQIFKDISKKSNASILIDFKKFKKLNEEIKIRVINDSIRQLKRNYYNLRSRKVVNLIERIEKKNYSKLTLGGCLILKIEQYLLFKKEKS